MHVTANGRTLCGSSKATHTITIPGTKFQAWVNGEEAAIKLAAKLAKTSTGKVGRRTIKAQPIIKPLEVEK